MTFQVFFFFEDFIDLFMRDTEREAETQAEGEAGPCGELNARLDPRTPGSPPEPKTQVQPQSHPGAPLSTSVWLNEFSDQSCTLL